MTNIITADDVAEAMFILAAEYDAEGNKSAAAKLVDAALTLPDTSLARLAEIIMSADQ